MRKFMTRALSIVISSVLLISSLGIVNTENVLAAPKKDDKKQTEKTSDTPEIEVTYETGTQNNAKTKRDDEESVRTENDGSYDVFIPGEETSLDENGEIIVDEDEASEIVWEDIHISTPEDFSEFCKNCRLDVWSQNKNVYLDNDIIITTAEYDSVPIFGGHFYGNNHTISGYSMHEARSYTGLFAYTQKTAVIEGLTVKATIKSDGKQIVTGGIVGENHGEIRNCSFYGDLSGQNYVGGIAGYNELTGNILNCRSYGEITGSYYTGGITGENVGNISSCINEAAVNTVNIDKVTSVQEIDLSSYADGLISKITGQAEDKTTNKSVVDSGSVDTGGIAGISIGVIQFCDNKGDVGYEHVGYNTGGIVGRQSGYVHGCNNEGIVRGRKDVGGIVGQAEPYVVVDFTEDTITKLSENIDKLHDIIDDTLSDAGVTSDTISNRLSIVKEFTDKALDQTSFLSDKTIDWTNGMVGAGNEVMGRAQYIMSETSKNDGPIDNGAEAFDDTKKAASQLNDTVRDLDIYRYMTDAQKEQYNDSKDRFEFLTKEIAENETKYQKAAENYYINNLHSDATTYPKSADLEPFDKYGNNLSSQISSYGDDLTKWENVYIWRHGSSNTDPEIGTKEEARESDAQLVKDAGTEYKDATTSPKRSDVEDAANKASKKAYEEKYGDMPATQTIDRELADQAGTMAGIIAAITPAMDEATRKDAQKTADSLKNASEHLADAGRQTKDIISSVASKGGITMPSLGQDYKDATTALNAALQGMSDNMGALNTEMADSSDVMIDDMGDVNDQFNVIMQLYADALDGVLDGDYGDNIEDTSMEVASTCVDATIADCENTGKIEGDIDVAGIAGSMGIEYDFDLESDLTKSDDATFNSAYQSKCVLRKNRNSAHIIAQKSYAGGICGLQEIGTVLQCENYGKVKSNSSDYVGGICGDSLSYIQKSVAKCFLYGKNYVGGIAGHGCNILNCYAMVQADEKQADSFYGAIAGDVLSEGKIHYNYYVGDALAGIDRVSYKGQAEQISYETFIGIDTTPALCQKMYAVFYIDDVEVDRIETTYGGTILKEQFPVFVGEDDTYCSWNKDDLTDMLFDVEVEGEYKRYITSLASDQMRMNDQSAILVDGRFTERDKLSSTSWDISSLPIDGAIEHWELSYPSGANDSHLIRYKNPDHIDADTEIYINNAGRWDKVETKTFGAYKTFEAYGPHVEFAVKQLKPNKLKQILIIVAIALGVILLIFFIIRIVKNTKKNNMLLEQNNQQAGDTKAEKTSEKETEKTENSKDEADMEIINLRDESVE